MIEYNLPYCYTCKRIEDGNANNCDLCVPSVVDGFVPSKYYPRTIGINQIIKKEEKSMIVTIIGSLTKKKGNG